MGDSGQILRGSDIFMLVSDYLSAVSQLHISIMLYLHTHLCSFLDYT